MHIYVFFAMLAGRWSKGEGLGERVNPLRAVLDTFDQRVDGFWGPWGRILVVRQGAGNILQYCCPGWLGWGGPRIEVTTKLEGKMMILAPGPAVQQIAGLGQQD